MSETETHPFPDRIIVSGAAVEYPAELKQARCELTIARLPSGAHEVIEFEGKVLEQPRPATREEIASCVELTPAMAHGLVTGHDVANPRFEVDDKIAPGPESILRPPPGAGTVKARFYCQCCNGWHYVVDFGKEWGPFATMLESRMRPAEANEAAPDGWQGTPPAEGTRRALIFDAICSAVRKRLDETGQRPFDERDEKLALTLADAVESALLEQTIDGEDGDVSITASDGTSIGSLEVVLGVKDGAPYVSLADLERAFANLYEDVTNRQARDSDQADTSHGDREGER